MSKKYEEMLEYWAKNDITPVPQRVVCAANKHPETGVVITGARHWDDIMHQQARAIAGTDTLKGTRWLRAEQGFIDQFGTFLTRKEAMAIVVENKQQGTRTPLAELTEKCLRSEDGARLFSEDLY